jgi:hypothetical protein
MKKNTLLGLTLVIFSLAAHAWTKTSQRPENFVGSHKIYHSIKCNSGNTIVLVYQASMVLGDYHVENTQRYLKVKSLDDAAKTVCYE